MLKKCLIVLLCLIAIMSFSACGSKNKESDKSTDIPGSGQEENKLKVSVTFDAMKEFVYAVAKDKVIISTIMPAGANSHAFEPKAQDLVELSQAEIFVYNGLGMEGWVEEAISAADNPNLIAVDASQGADVIEIEASAGDSGNDHPYGNYDPHLWLGLKGAQAQVKNIKDALVKADPANKDYYEENYEDFTGQLESLYNEYSSKFQSLEKKSFVTGHAAFAYLCRDFNLEQNSVRDIFAEGEPSALQLAQLVEYCRENKVTTIFSEEMVSPELSETLANEVGAKVEIIYTMENPQDKMTYLERMESNLSKIYDSLAG